MVEFYNCSVDLAALNASNFRLADWFNFDSYAAFHDYVRECKRSYCSNDTQDASTSCPASLDNMAGSCWPRTLANEAAFIPCPSHIDRFQPDRKAFRICGHDGEWKTPSFNDCISEDAVTSVKVLLCYLGGSFSIASCLIAIVIFHCMPILHCGRVTLHKHFFLSNIGYSACWILKYSVVDVAVLTEPGWCHMLRALEVLTVYFTLTNILWMFSEGLFLYAHVVLGFVSEQRLMLMCMLFGWGLPAASTVVFITRAAMMSAEAPSENTSVYCWALAMADAIVHHCVIGPIALALLVNFYFLVHIVVILWMKMRGVTENSRETNQTRKAARAVLILFPLLGIQQLFLVTQPEQSSHFFPAYEIMSMIFTSCQGTFVAVIFCFANGEVIAALKRKSRVVRWLFKPCSADESQAVRNVSLPPNHSISTVERRTSASNNYSQLNVREC